MKDFVFYMGFLSLFIFDMTLAIQPDELDIIMDRLQKLYKTDIQIDEKLLEKDKKIEELTDKINKMETANFSLKNLIEELRTRTTHNENNIGNHDERITNLSGKYLCMCYDLMANRVSN